jgi:hypothetical protein
MTPIELFRDEMVVDIDDAAKTVTLSKVPVALKEAGVRSGIITEIRGLNAYQRIAQAAEAGESLIEIGVSTKWVFDGNIPLSLIFHESAAAETRDAELIVPTENPEPSFVDLAESNFSAVPALDAGVISGPQASAAADEVAEIDEPAASSAFSPENSNRARLGLPPRSSQLEEHLRRQAQRPVSYSAIDPDYDPYAEPNR